jgi:hypothetical protein
MPQWLYNLAIILLVTAGICFLIIAVDIFTKNPQNMWIMQVVWPVIALWSGTLGLYDDLWCQEKRLFRWTTAFLLRCK